MTTPTRPRIVIVGHLADQFERFTCALGEWGEVMPAGQELPAGGQPDVVITDVPAALLTSELGRAGERRRALPVQWALVGIGETEGVDVSLPTDWTERELRIACRAAIQIAALRAQCEELARLRQQVAQLAETDPLTGLPNRRAWETRLPTMLARAGQTGQPLWLALVDLDSFKTINDRDGMLEGDRVLTATGQALAGSLRRSDLVARLGGDEFGVLLSNVPAERIAVVLDRLCAAVAAGGQVTASIGYVTVRRGDDVSQAVAVAERAMRDAKRAGGNRHQQASTPEVD